MAERQATCALCPSSWGKEPEPIHEVPALFHLRWSARQLRPKQPVRRLTDPRDFVTESKYDPIPMTEAETYCNLMGRLQMEAQTWEWVRGRLNLYGTDGLEMLRKGVDLGIYSVADDIQRITAIRGMLSDFLDLLADQIEPDRTLMATGRSHKKAAFQPLENRLHRPSFLEPACRSYQPSKGCLRAALKRKAPLKP